MKRAATVTLVLGVLSGCGGPQTTSLQAPAVTIQSQKDSVYAGGTGTTVYASYGGNSEAPSWSLDGPGAISGTISTSSGTVITYTPPPTTDSVEAATLTVNFGAVQASTVINVLPPPFIFSPPSPTVKAGDGMTPVLVMSRDPAQVLSWYASSDGPGDVEISYAPSEIMYYPPPSIAVPTVATVQVFLLDHSYVQDLLVTINPR